MPETNAHVEILDSVSNFLQPIQLASTGWTSIELPTDLPSTSGLYAIYSEPNGTCLYIGQSENLQKRILHHWAWKKAYYTYGLPHVTYKVIERENPDETKRELIYSECLLIGLLRPQWNAAVPAPRSEFAPYSHEKLAVVHWSKVVDKCYEPFHQSMLTDEGYLVSKQVKILTVSGSIQTRWRRILYDNEYVKEFIRDLADQIDAFFVLREGQRSDESSIDDKSDSSIPLFSDNTSDT